MFDLEIDDIVVIAGHENRPLGRVISINKYDQKFTVRFTDETMIPPYMEYTFINYHMGYVKKQYTWKLKLKCECGVDSVGEGLHSGWCPKYQKDNA